MYKGDDTKPSENDRLLFRCAVELHSGGSGICSDRESFSAHNIAKLSLCVVELFLKIFGLGDREASQ